MEPANKLFRIAKVGDPKALRRPGAVIAQNTRHNDILDSISGRGLALGDKAHRFRIAVQLEQQADILACKTAQIESLCLEENFRAHVQFCARPEHCPHSPCRYGAIRASDRADEIANNEVALAAD